MEEIQKILQKLCKTSILDLRNIEVENIFASTGGSLSNNFLISSSKLDKKVVIKIAPILFGVQNQKKVVLDNSPYIELEILKLLNKEILKKKKSPSIPFFYGSQECPNIRKILQGEKCYQFNSNLTDPINLLKVNNCLTRERLDRELISQKYLVSATEYSGMPFYIFLEDPKISDHEKEHLIICLLFQVVFTLAVIQKALPTFRHNDLSNFNNILLRDSNNQKARKKYDEYFVGKNYYPISREYQFVIIDYGLSSVKGKIKPNYEVIKKGPRFGAVLSEAKNHKKDLFNFINSLDQIANFFYPNNQIISDSLLNDLNRVEYGSKKNKDKTVILNYYDLPESHSVYKPLKTPEQFLKKFPWDKYLDKYVPKKYEVISEYYL